MEIKHVPIVEKKKLMLSGGSVVLSVPKQWLDENGLKAGEEVLMVANGDLKFMKIDKESISKLRNQLSNIQTDPVTHDCITGERDKGGK